LSLSSSKEVSLDVVQSTFLSAITSIGRFDGKCSIKTWLFSIARHELYKYWRKNKNHLDIDDAILMVMEDSVEDSAINREERKALKDAVAMLDDMSKQIVLLRIGSDLTFGDIGRILDKSEVYCRVTFYRAKQRLIGILRKGGFA
jgi:RNA polymerase sigma-70 factor (ECF subfamily)